MKYMKNPIRSSVRSGNNYCGEWDLLADSDPDSE